MKILECAIIGTISTGLAGAMGSGLLVFGIIEPTKERWDGLFVLVKFMAAITMVILGFGIGAIIINKGKD